MPSLASSTFNAAALLTATINNKPRTCAKEVSKALKYG